MSIIAADQPVSFSRDIQPILETSCWKCHGDAVQLSKLDLRNRDAALKGGQEARRSFPARPPRAGSTASCQGSKSQPCQWTANSPRPRSSSSRTGSIRAPRGTWPPVTGSPQTQPRNWRLWKTCRFRRRPATIGRFRNLSETPFRRSAGNPGESDRSLPGKDAPRQGSHSRAAGRSDHASAPRLHGPDRAAADSRRNRRSTSPTTARVPGKH